MSSAFGGNYYHSCLLLELLPPSATSCLQHAQRTELHLGLRICSYWLMRQGPDGWEECLGQGRAEMFFRVSSMVFFLCSISVLLDPICKQVWVVNCTSPCRSHPSAQFQKNPSTDVCPIFHESSPSHSSLAERPLPPRSSLPTSGAAVASTRGSPSPSPGFPSRSGSLVFVAAFRGFLYHWARACVQIALSPQTQSTPDSKPHVPSTLAGLKQKGRVGGPR